MSRCIAEARIGQFSFNKHGIFRLKEAFVKRDMTGSFMDRSSESVCEERKREGKKERKHRYLNPDIRVFSLPAVFPEAALHYVNKNVPKYRKYTYQNIILKKNLKKLFYMTQSRQDRCFRCQKLYFV